MKRNIFTIFTTVIIVISWSKNFKFFFLEFLLYQCNPTRLCIYIFYILLYFLISPFFFFNFMYQASLWAKSQWWSLIKCILFVWVHLDELHTYLFRVKTRIIHFKPICTREMIKNIHLDKSSRRIRPDKTQHCRRVGLMKRTISDSEQKHTPDRFPTDWIRIQVLKPGENITSK